MPSCHNEQIHNDLDNICNLNSGSKFIKEKIHEITEYQSISNTKLLSSTQRIANINIKFIREWPKE